MELWNISGDMVPVHHAEYLKYRAYQPHGDIELLEITPEWLYGAPPADELIYASNNHAAREELSTYSDGMGGSCADHVTTSRGMLAVPLWRDDETGADSGYHPAAIVGLSLLARMEDYLLLDESDYCEREMEAWQEYIADEFNWIDDGEREDEIVDRHRACFLDYAWEHIIGYYSVFDVPADAINRAYNETKGESNNA